MKAISRTEK
jgi:hypothetical protein